MHLNISGCQRVRFGVEAIKTMRNIRNIDLKNINQLTLEEHSLKWEGYDQRGWDSYRETPTLKVHIESSNIEKMSSYTLQGKISEIVLKNVTVRHISAYAVNSLKQNHLIELTNVNFQFIDAQAFKKFPTDNFIITNCNFDVVPSYTLMDIQVNERFLIKNSKFKVIRSGGFFVNNPRVFEVTNTQIDTIEGDGFKVRTKNDAIFDNIHVKNAAFGAFLGISSSSDLDKFLVINNATFENAEPGSFKVNLTSFIPKFSAIKLQVKCQCTIVDSFLVDPNLHDLNCFEGRVSMTFKSYKQEFCTSKLASTTIIIVVCVVVAILVFLIAFLVYFCKKRYHSGRYGGKKDKVAQEEKVVMPEGKTYRETEIMYIVERADLLTTDL